MSTSRDVSLPAAAMKPSQCEIICASRCSRQEMLLFSSVHRRSVIVQMSQLCRSTDLHQPSLPACSGACWRDASCTASLSKKLLQSVSCPYALSPPRLRNCTATVLTPSHTHTSLHSSKCPRRVTWPRALVCVPVCVQVRPHCADALHTRQFLTRRRWSPVRCDAHSSARQGTLLVALPKEVPPPVPCTDHSCQVGCSVVPRTQLLPAVHVSLTIGTLVGSGKDN